MRPHTLEPSVAAGTPTQGPGVAVEGKQEKASPGSPHGTAPATLRPSPLSGDPSQVLVWAVSPAPPTPPLPWLTQTFLSLSL